MKKAGSPQYYEARADAARSRAATEGVASLGIIHAKIALEYDRMAREARNAIGKTVAGAPLPGVPRYDIAYSLERELVERVAAQAAQDQAVRDSHMELANRYADRAWGAREALCEDGNPC